MSQVRRFLDLSTAHLSPSAVDALMSPSGPANYKTDFGWFVYVPDDCADYEPPLPADLMVIFNHARRHHCAYILFDRDAPQDFDLPVLWSDPSPEPTTAPKLATIIGDDWL